MMTKSKNAIQESVAFINTPNKELQKIKKKIPLEIQATETDKLPRNKLMRHVQILHEENV